MGGWCARRETCAYYRPGSMLPALERLCEPGTFDAFEPRGADGGERSAGGARDPHCAADAAVRSTQERQQDLL